MTTFLVGYILTGIFDGDFVGDAGADFVDSFERISPFPFTKHFNFQISSDADFGRGFSLKCAAWSTEVRISYA
jgi:hypothetical protein